ncbi:MAG: replication restart helicase PriA, partial [Desulfovibrionales bacterium]
PSIVVGTRSALFLPMRDPGLVILDEEHDSSFKQDEQLVYQAKELAYFLSRENKALMVLGSATPDVKTSYAAEQGSIPRVFLNARILDRKLPSVDVVNLLQEPPKSGPLSPRCLQALTGTLEHGGQVVILQNRRGYAHLVYCPGCGQVARCPNCEVGLTYHKSVEKLLCHYCGYSLECPQPCTHCGESDLLPLGEGTEQIEEFVRREFPDIGVVRLDRDSIRSRGRMEELLDRFARKEAGIMVGTQMISKGHHFPGVTMVVVVDGDLGLNLPDYRATERTFQLLVQVAGRAGRGEAPGTVFIQTRNPDHYCWKYVRESDYHGFYRTEIERRRKLSYPPFVKLGLIRMSFPLQWKEGKSAVMDISRALNATGKALNVRILGPAPSPLPVLRGRSRFQCLLKGERWENIRGLYARALETAPANRALRMHLDLDPMAML